MRSLSERYKRWRHTRGYGVHSPFAYMLVNEVVHPPKAYGYYNYDAILPDIPHNYYGKIYRHACTLLRLSARLDVDSAYIPQYALAVPFIAALKGANSGMRITAVLADADNCTLIGTASDYVPLATLKKLLQKEGRIVAMRNVPSDWDIQLFEALPSGIMLHSPHELIVINRPYTQKVAYSVNF